MAGYGFTLFIVSAGLILTAATFAPLVDAEPPEVVTPVPVYYDPPQIAEELDAAGMAQVGATNLFNYLGAMQAAEREAFLNRLRARWWPVHTCEQGTDWYAGPETNGHGTFEGGMGHDRSNYIKYRGHSSMLDPPDVQMLIAEMAWQDGVRWAPSCMAKLGPPL